MISPREREIGSCYGSNVESKNHKEGYSKKTNSPSYEADISFDPYSSNLTTTNTSTTNILKHQTTNPNSIQCTSPNTNNTHNIIDLITVTNSSCKNSNNSPSPFLRHIDSNDSNLNTNSSKTNYLQTLNDNSNDKLGVLNLIQNSLQTIDKIKFNSDQANIFNNKVPIQIKNLEENTKKLTKKLISTKDYQVINKNEVLSSFRNESETRLKNYSGLFKVIQSTFCEIKNMVLQSSYSCKINTKSI